MANVAALGSKAARQDFQKDLVLGRVPPALLRGWIPPTDPVVDHRCSYPLSAAEWASMEAIREARLEANREALRAEVRSIEEEEESRPLLDYLPTVWRLFLEGMTGARRKEREQAIWKKVRREELELLELDAEGMAASAEMRARKYAAKFPARTDAGELSNQEEEHKKGRCEKWQRRKLKKKQMEALLYIEAAIGAVGGPADDARPLYVSDYMLDRYQDHVERTEEILRDLRLVKKADPSVQLSMMEVNARAKRADAAKRRLLMDMNLSRWKSLNWHVCWITITLPGKFVCNATNEKRRASEWDTGLGPLEAMDELQGDMKRVMAILRDRGVRPVGWWNSQPQQSGSPHRHIILACQNIEDARAVCDAFRERFSTRLSGDKEGQDRGCAAYVLEDEDEAYCPPVGKNGQRETAATVARYAARYATRYEAKTTDSDEEASEVAGDQHRFAAWKWARRARTHTWLGLDSSRAPAKLWDTLWANAARSDYDPDDARMAIALQHMRSAQALSQDVAERRRALNTLPDGDRAALLEEIQDFADSAAFEAWHAAIALGMWPDSDLDKDERKWLREAVAEWEYEKNPEMKDKAVLQEEVLTARDALPPMPLREMRETVYGGTRKEMIGAVAPMHLFSMPQRAKKRDWLNAATSQGVEVGRNEKVRSAFARAGIYFIKRPDGTLAAFDLSGEILLRTEDEWEIVDSATAEEKLKEWEGNSGFNKGLSFNPTDPSYGAVPLPRVGEGPPS